MRHVLWTSQSVAQAKGANDTLFLCQGRTSANVTGSVSTDYLIMHMNCELRSIRSIYLFKLFQAQGSHYTVAVDGEGTYSERKEKERERETYADSSPCSSMVLWLTKAPPRGTEYGRWYVRILHTYSPPITCLPGINSFDKSLFQFFCKRIDPSNRRHHRQKAHEDLIKLEL